MLPFFADCFNRLQDLHAAIQRAIDGLPQDALDWSPGPDMNSLAVLIAHIAGSERYWIGDVAGRDPSNRNRDAEFRTQGQDAATLTARLDAALAHSRAVLDSLTLPDLEAKRATPSNGKEYTVGWALAHALEHVGIHVGHIQILRQLWDQSR